jgi:hypothetical protein
LEVIVDLVRILNDFLAMIKRLAAFATAVATTVAAIRASVEAIGDGGAIVTRETTQIMRQIEAMFSAVASPVTGAIVSFFRGRRVTEIRELLQNLGRVVLEKETFKTAHENTMEEYRNTSSWYTKILRRVGYQEEREVRAVSIFKQAMEVYSVRENAYRHRLNELNQ